jgi:uncharacterized repeat protein (TIGR02543 family)
VNVNPQQASYSGGQNITLTATPAAGWQFAGWSGDVTGSQNPKSFAITSDSVVTASFTALSTAAFYTLTVLSSGEGDVRIEPEQANYPYSQAITMTAIPADDWQFEGWSGDLIAVQNPIMLTITQNLIVTATFSISIPSMNDFYLPLLGR